MVSDRGSAGLADGAGRSRRWGVAVAGPRDGRGGDMAAAAGGGRMGARRHVCAAPVRSAAPRRAAGLGPANVAASRGGDARAGEGGGRAAPPLTTEWEVPTAAPLYPSARQRCGLFVTRVSRQRCRQHGLGELEWPA